MSRPGGNGDMPLKGGRARCHQLLHCEAELRKQLRGRPVERFTDNIVKRLTRFEAYYPQAATSEVDSRRLPGKTAADDNSISFEFRFVVPLPVFHKALELMRRWKAQTIAWATLQ